MFLQTWAMLALQSPEAASTTELWRPPIAARQAEDVAALFQAARGTSQRRSLLDALRPAIVAELGSPIEFFVRDIRVRQGWAFLSVRPQRPGGRPIRNRPRGAMTETVEVQAVLRLLNGNWQLIDHAIGATDVWYCEIRGAPTGLLPFC